MIAHEELGFAASGMSRAYWDSQSIMTRQEQSRNAAQRAGIVCPKGTYPELEMWLEMDCVLTQEDGTLVTA